uniref:Phospholipase B-like n=1 Tax=Callorhinchus milii TaxID=7868 RepID=A0A4W3IB51_CALMI
AHVKGHMCVGVRGQGLGLGLPLLLVLAAVGVSPSARGHLLRSVVLDEHSGRLRVVGGLNPHSIAWANLTDRIRATGWSFLEIGTNGKYNDSIQAYAAGVVEAAVTQPLIYMHWMNTMFNYCGPFKYKTKYCEKLRNYIETNLAWMERQMVKAKEDEYWYQIRLTLLQLQGLEDSYNDRVSFPVGKFSINPFGFILFQMGGDLEDLETALNDTNDGVVTGSGSCSALIKLLPGNKELLVAHDTWSNYQTMLRIIKKYNFSFSYSANGSVPVPGNVQSFSSYPGVIFSGDDFYILSSGLVTLETTIGNNNPDLWKFVQPVGSVMEWLRNIVANRLAKNGEQWASIFKRFNSGTYNNQWMIVDYNYFIPGRTDIKEKLLTVLEQIPGQIVVRDKTELLMRQGYWPSYNIPYFEEIFNLSGNLPLVAQYGDWFTYDKNPRAKIFRRNQTMVTDMASMIKLMRYNDYLHDPLSKYPGCDPSSNGENSISSRSDLNPANGTYLFPALEHRSHGGTDMKVTSSEMYKTFEMIAISGPAWDQVPPFQWSKSSYSGLIHMGHPDLWKFPPVMVRWS